MNYLAKRSLITKFKLLGLVIVLSVIRYSWPEMEKPGKPDPTVVAWEGPTPWLKKHPCQTTKEYLKGKYLKPPLNDYFIDNE